MGVEFLQRPDDGEFDFHEITPADVVILPAFGVTVKDFERLRAVGCVLVDTTCGSVLNVWKRVDSYAKDGFTAVIHGKYYHEETKATSSQATKYPSGKYLVVRHRAEAREVCAYIEAAGNGEQSACLFEGQTSPGIDPESGAIRFRPVGAKGEQVVTGWLPSGALTVGVTAGASTPNNKIGETVERIAASRGVSLLR